MIASKGFDLSQVVSEIPWTSEYSFSFQGIVQRKTFKVSILTFVSILFLALPVGIIGSLCLKKQSREAQKISKRKRVVGRWESWEHDGDDDDDDDDDEMRNANVCISLPNSIDVLPLECLTTPSTIPSKNPLSSKRGLPFLCGWKKGCSFCCKFHHPNTTRQTWAGYEFTSCWRNRWKVLLIQKARVLVEDSLGSLGDGHETGHSSWSNSLATSHELFIPNGGLVREIPLFQGNLGW